MIKTTVTRFKMLERGEKAADGTPAETSGQWEAIVSVFGNVDMYGDKVMPGAFTKTLEEWDASGDPIPVYYSHRMDDPTMLIGHCLDAQEVEAKDGNPPGLWTRSQADLDKPTAAQVFDSMSKRLLRESSFSYNVREDRYVPPADADADPFETGDFGHFELLDLKLFEYGPTPVGANPDTVLLGTKAGSRLAVPRRLARKAMKALAEEQVTALQDARDLINRVLSDSDQPDEDDTDKSGLTRGHTGGKGAGADDILDRSELGRLLMEAELASLPLL